MAGHFQEFEDEYLETMYEFYEQNASTRVRTGDLAERLGVSPASATEMVQGCQEKDSSIINATKVRNSRKKGLNTGG